MGTCVSKTTRLTELTKKLSFTLVNLEADTFFVPSVVNELLASDIRYLASEVTALLSL